MYNKLEAKKHSVQDTRVHKNEVYKKIEILKLLKQGYRYTNYVNLFLNSIDATMIWYQNLIRDSNLFLSKAYRYCITDRSKAVHLLWFILFVNVRPLSVGL